MDKNKCIIIMGMHKGGTSLTASIVDALGVDLGREYYIHADGINQRGYFENYDITKMNDYILESIDADWMNPAEVNNPDMVNIERYKKEIWGWKDPRTTFTLESYLPHLKEYDIKLIFVKRNKESNVLSLLRT